MSGEPAPIPTVAPAIWRVPGKLVLIGEYAAVDGAPAAVAAIDRGVQVEVCPLDPEVGARGEAAGLDGGGRIEVPAGADDRFARAGLGWDAGGEGAVAGRAPAAIYRFTDWNPPDLPSKAGFGGSAAAVVAARLAGGLPVEAAAEIHRRVQGGGSGIDVFASARGGARRFPSGEEIDVPPMIAVWSGQSAKTGPRVQCWRAWAGRATFVAESARLVEAFERDPIPAAAAAYRLLCAMARESGMEAAGLPYDTPALRRIAEMAAEFGGAAKPSGAGGGDVAVAFFPDLDRLAAFAARVAGAGLWPIPVRVVRGPLQRSATG